MCHSSMGFSKSQIKWFFLFAKNVKYKIRGCISLMFGKVDLEVLD
jgi:hypothetical protein